MFNTLILRTVAEKAVLRNPELEEQFFYFDPEMLKFRTYVVVMDGSEVVGMVAVNSSSIWFENSVGVGFVETREDYRNRGISKLLVEGLFKLAKEEGKDIANTPYSPNGLLWLKPVMHQTAERYPDVTLHER